ncbi:MAG: hypothetical protein QM482_06350 [Sulfurospirillum sp.]
MSNKTRVRSGLSPLASLFIFALLLQFTTKLFATDYNNEANFTQIYTKTVNGDIAATGSPIMCADDGNDQCDWNYGGYLFDINPLALNDGGSSNFSLNSGGAVLSLPADVNGSDILWARLYWQGHIFGLGNSTDFNNAISGLENVKMIDSRGKEHNISANSSDIYYYGYDNQNVYNNETNGYRYFYQASQDVTQIVKDSYDKNHNYFTVGNINATITKDTYYILDTKLNAYVKWGNWGGWSLIVAYKDPNISIKNISLYDGFKFLLPPFGGTASLTIDLPPNSFYTPNYGVVKSKTIMFAAGAEKKIAADKLEMYNKNNGYLTISNTLNPADNQINDSITYLDNEINATRIFNAGIDLDTYDTSSILANGQTSTSLKVTMTASEHAADQAFVGFIGISNDIYQPKICYNEQLFDNNNTEINASSYLNVGDILQIKLTIRNDDNETANDVSIIHNFDDNKTIYESNSTIVNNIDSSGTLIGDVNQTDLYGDDLVDFNSTDKSITVRLGRGGNFTNGGNFIPNDTVYTEYKTKINTNQALNLSYQTSYTFNIAGQTFSFNGPLPKCTDFNNTIQAYLPPIGFFNVVNGYTAINGSDPIDSNNSVNALFTQITNVAFPIKILHLNSIDKTTLENFNGIAFLEVIDGSAITSNQDSCLNAAVEYTIPPNDIPNFNDESSKDINISIPKAIRNATFRVGYTDWGTRINNSNVTCVSTSTIIGNLKGVPQCLNSENKILEVFPDKNISECLTSGPYGENAACNPSNYNSNGSKGNIQPEKYNNKYGCAQCLVGNYICARDNFSVRPATYSIDIIDINSSHIGGKLYPLDINATDGTSDINVSGYNQTINNSSDKNGTIGVIVPPGCTDINTSKQLFDTNIVFASGKVNQPVYFSYNNIGDINITLNDKDWTKVDQSAFNGKTFDDCIAGSFSNTLSSGKVGCLIKGSQTLTFVPKTFRISLNISNFLNQPFTYISKDGNMSAKMNWDFIALLDDNTTLTLNDNPVATNYTKNCFAKDINYTVKLINDLNLTWSDASHRIKFYGDSNTSISTLVQDNNGSGLADFNSSQINFNNGKANITIRFNFDRNISISDQPFHIRKNDFNISVKDTNNVTGSDFNRTNDSNTTFYYGRVHAPDYRFAGTSDIATIYYEVYCKDCNKTNYNITGNESVDSIYWYLNPLHINNDGNVTQFSSVNSVTFNGNNPTVNSGTITSGIENINLTAPKTPYKDKIKMQPSSWLLHNLVDQNATTNDFLVEFYGKGDWAGQGHQGKTVDLNISTIQNRRLDW